MRPAAVNVKRSERSSEAGMNSEKIKDLPTAAQLESEMKRIRYKRGYLKTLFIACSSSGCSFDINAFSSGSSCYR